MVSKGGMVQDLHVDGTIVSEYKYAGGICGRNKGTISNCTVSGTISCNEIYVGGICGENTCIISNCRVSANVSSTSRLVGGITGQNTGAGTITNCWVSADVSSNWTGSGYAKVGGIAGENNGTIEYCCMTGNVTNYDDNVAGIAGDNNNSTISHCVFYGILYRSTSEDYQNDNIQLNADLSVTQMIGTTEANPSAAISLAMVTRCRSLYPTPTRSIPKMYHGEVCHRSTTLRTPPSATLT